jgi:hypothetical protein
MLAVPLGSEPGVAGCDSYDHIKLICFSLCPPYMARAVVTRWKTITTTADGGHFQHIQ